MSLTKKQSRILNEINEIKKELGIEFNENNFNSNDEKTAVLESIKDQLIRSEVVTNYTLIDELLGYALAKYFLKKKVNYRRGRGKKFNEFILEQLFLVPKIEFVKEKYKIPEDILETLFELNKIRNSVTHSFFPQDRRKQRPLFKKKNIYTLEGFLFFSKETNKATDYFVKQLYM